MVLRNAFWEPDASQARWVVVRDASLPKGSNIVSAAYWEILKSNPFSGENTEEEDRPWAMWYPEGSQREFVTQCLEQTQSTRMEKMQQPHVRKCFFSNPYLESASR